MMKLFTGWVLAAGLALAATAAQAQVPAPYEAGRAPYYRYPTLAAPMWVLPMRAALMRRRRGNTPDRATARGRCCCRRTEVYTVVRESGFSPLGIPRQRGFVYTIAVIDRGGDDGRLIIDARTGRIIRFMPARRIGDNFDDDLTMSYGQPGPLPPMTGVRAAPRPPKPVPHVASRTVPVPKASPLAAANKPAAAPEPSAKPAAAAEPARQAAPVQQSAVAQPKPAEAQTPPAAAVTTGAVQAKPAPQILPTQEMPKVQGLE